jgi:AraC-like DNA-binding protein
MYREINPAPELTPYVECFWISEVQADGSTRILPDGCIDLLFFTQGKQVVDARVVGAMTRFQDVSLRRDQAIVGVRFQPGMAGACLPCDIPRLNDRSVAMSAALGDAAKALVEVFSCRSSIEARVEKLGPRLVCRPTVSEPQQAIGELVRKRGQLRLCEFADAAKLGERQLRRSCYKHSGLAPKQLARILRFRHAATRFRSGVKDHARVALDCGYYDQAHMIRDFRDLAGTSPARYQRQNGG